MQHRLRFFITINFLITASSCSAMNEQPNILAELITKSKSPQAEFINNNHVIIADDSECRIINFITGETVTTIYNAPSNLAVHSNKKKFALYDRRAGAITIYDTATGTKQWSKKNTNTNNKCAISLAIFSPLDDSILACYSEKGSLILHNYTTDQNLTFNYDSDQSICPPTMSFHPTKREICLGYSPGIVCTYKQDDFSLLQSIDKDLYARHDSEYSPNGALLASSSQNHGVLRINIKESNSYTTVMQYATTEEFAVYSIAFHPNSSVLAILNQSSKSVKYRDIKKNLIINTTSLLDHFKEVNYICSHDLSFSPDGKKLMVALKNKCVILPVPFEVIYQPETRQQAICVYWLLKNYKDDQGRELPGDIKQLLMYNLLETFKR